MKDTQEEPLTLAGAGMANSEFLALCRGLPISRAQYSVLSAAREVQTTALALTYKKPELRVQG